MANDKTESGYGKYEFIVNNESLYITQNAANSVKGEPQLAVPNEMRKRVISIAHARVLARPLIEFCHNFIGLDYLRMCIIIAACVMYARGIFQRKGRQR